MMRETVTILRDDLIQVRVPLPFPLRWVNAYVLKGKNGFTVIDPGLHTKDSEEAWEKAFQELGIKYDQVEQVVLTHYHPDHYGMAGWFQERAGGAPVLLSETGIRLTSLMWGAEQPMTRLLCESFAQHGLPTELRDEMTNHMREFVDHVSPQPAMTAIAAGELVRLGDRLYEAIETPGHAAGHLCFYNREAREILCGDHVLPQISPNVSYMPDVDEDPLRAYLSSLAAVQQLSVDAAYPGHREPFAKFGERAAELIVHHHERLSVMVEHLRHPMTAYELCRTVFGFRLTTHQLRFALAETIAHLVYLEGEGRIKRSERDGVISYQT
ncbi:MBL fold metallo-hydrolase [Paenibacillus albiflavus]|uniref:MBL fold metallo-hydrolase n=1 Tax=Paenibacillus albiflavus TaxID=2545760 RepID=A0A4R4E683_9BACL|nr:MBL fold metallo-hydrolase [Paenibacillus albiflavus]TCZ73185.1 MBL fold metallo-hydrolase [Paenibacillus albiflavus]